MFFFDPMYLLFSLPALLVAIIAQLLVKYFYSKYSRVPNTANMSGAEVVSEIARRNNFDIRLNVSLQDLSDHYNPINKELTLSDKVARNPSIASVGIAAHEMGHVMQHRKGFFLMSIRNVLPPIVNLGTTLAYLLFLIGWSFQIFGLILAGIVFFSVSTFFTLITLPIEVDASRRALKMVKELQLLTPSETNGVRNVLIAAALTYVAALLQSLSTLLYYVFRAMGVRRD